jgi:phosphopantetheinyl transferase (holo-ACP synthase)
MLGNDVVDLADPEARAESLHPGFDRRVFDPEERTWLRVSCQPERDRWVLWAAKESAYKAARRLDSKVVFSPVRFVVRLQSDPTGFAGRVSYAAQQFTVRVEVGARFVHAVSRLASWPGAEPLSAVRVVPGDGALAPSAASAEVRGLARRALAAALDLAPAAVSVGRSGRLPLLRLAGRESSSALSFSHHGRCAAFAASLP